MEDATAVDVPGVGAVGLFDAQGEVFLEFFVETLFDVARGDVFAVFAEEGGVVDGEEHGHCWLVDGDCGEGLGVVAVGHGVAYVEAVESYDGAYVAALYGVDLVFAHAVVDVEFFDSLSGYGAVAFAEGDVLSGFEFTAVYASYGDAACVGGVFH